MRKNMRYAHFAEKCKICGNRILDKTNMPNYYYYYTADLQLSLKSYYCYEVTLVTSSS